MLLLLTALVINTTAFCSTEDLDDVRKLMQVSPYVTQPDDVKALFGEPTSIERLDKVTVWTYARNDRGIKFYWDMRVVRLQEYRFATAPQAKDVPMNGTCKLETGITDLPDIIMLYGNPQNMHIERNNQIAQYLFNNANITLRFRDGKLANYDVNGYGPRKS